MLFFFLNKKKVRSGGERSARSTRLANTVSLRLLKAKAHTHTPLLQQLPAEEREREQKKKQAQNFSRRYLTKGTGVWVRLGWLSVSLLLLLFLILLSFFFPLFLVLKESRDARQKGLPTRSLAVCFSRCNKNTRERRRRRRKKLAVSMGSCLSFYLCVSFPDLWKKINKFKLKNFCK